MVYVVPKLRKLNIEFRTYEGNVISNEEMEVASDITYINTSKLNAPEGYEIAVPGNMPIKNDTVIVIVKCSTKVIRVYYKTIYGKCVDVDKMTVSVDTTTVNVGKLNVPEGYKLVQKGNVTIIKNRIIVKVSSLPRKNISSLKFSKVKNYFYTGNEITPSVVIKNGSKTLRVGKDYTISYRNNKKPGLATIVILGKGIYKGQKTIKFRIVAR